MTLRIFVDEFEFALGGNEDEVESFLDLQTGEVVTIATDAYDRHEEDDDIRENKERYRYIEPVGLTEGAGGMSAELWEQTIRSIRPSGSFGTA